MTERQALIALNRMTGMGAVTAKRLIEAFGSAAASLGAGEDELRAVPGQFAHSDFVQSITGVDNVCERAAVLAAGGPVWAHKWARDGVTFAVALRPFTPDWRWNDG